MKNKKIKIIALSLILVTIIVGGVIKLESSSKVKKSNKSLEVAIEHLSKGKPLDAREELNNSLELDENNEGALKILELTDVCIEIKDAYMTKDYNKVEELVTKATDMKHFDLVEEIVKEMNENIESRKKFLNDVDEKVGKFIADNKYDEGIKFVDELIEGDKSEQIYTENLIGLSEKLKQSKKSYEEEQLKLAEEKRKEEEKKKQDLAKLEVNSIEEAIVRVQKIGELDPRSNGKSYNLRGERGSYDGMNGYKILLYLNLQGSFYHRGEYFVDEKSGKVYEYDMVGGKYYLIG